MRAMSILLIGLTLFSCGKKHTVHIKAVNPATGQVYVGLKYRISQEKTTLWDEKTKVIANGELNENGEANATFRRGNHPIRVQIEWPSNCCYSKNDVYYIKGDGPNHEVLVEFAECATLQRKVKNINCVDSNDKIEIHIDNSVHSLLSAPWILNGCTDYTTTPTQVPIGNYTLHWIVTKNNISTDYYDSFNLIENETKIHEINY